MKDYKKYVKKELWKQFEKQCKVNSLDFYSSGIVTSTHIVMENLMAHTFKGVWKKKKVSVKEAWEEGIKNHGHSGMSAAITATIIAKYSPRGEEFKKWCIKDNVVMVDWSEEDL